MVELYTISYGAFSMRRSDTLAVSKPTMFEYKPWNSADKNCCVAFTAPSTSSVDGMYVSDTTYPIWYKVSVTDDGPPGIGAAVVHVVEREGRSC
jgi:hypothetical protein